MEAIYKSRICKFQWSPLWLIFLAFLASRSFYLLSLHIQFNANPINNFWQFLDPVLLKTDLLRSIYYLHQQPPLFNLFLGVILKLFPEHWSVAFQLCYLLMGLVFALALFKLMVEMGVSPIIATSLTVIHAILPATLLYENWLFYEYPAAILICLSALFLCRFSKYFKISDGVIFFGLLTILMLTRGFFQPYWVIFFLLLLLYVCEPQGKLILKAALFPMLVIVIFAVKQYIVFGTWTTGDVYVGSNLAGRINQRIPSNLRQTFMQEYDLPPYFFAHPFQDMSQYKNFLPAIQPTGIPALDQEKKMHGSRNLNYIGYLLMTNGYASGFAKITLHHPAFYFSSFSSTWRYFLPSSEDAGALGPNQNAIMDTLLHYSNMLFCGQWQRMRNGIFLMIAFPVIILFGLIEAIRKCGKRTAAQRAYQLTMFYMVTNIVYVSFIAVAVSLGDYNRYRFIIDSFYLVIFAVMLHRIQQYIIWKRTEPEKYKAIS